MPTVLKWIFILLSPFIALYTFLVYLRNKFYDWNLVKSCSVSTTVISVGNLQIGGTGKTPMVEFLGKYLLEKKQQVVILSRGYRRSLHDLVLIDSNNSANVSPDLVGDEPFQLFQNLPGVKLAIGSNRCDSAERALEKWPDSVLLLDDGFQHRKISRDVNIVMLDPSRWSRLPLLFPLSNFRDVRSSLKRAHLVVINQHENDPELYRSLERRLKKSLDIPVFKSSIIPREVCPLNSDKKLVLNELKGLKVAIFCGIANPERFTTMVEKLGGEVCFKRFFRDHHQYRFSDFQQLERNALNNKADLLLTTQKDAVKLEPYLEHVNIHLYYLPVRTLCERYSS